MADLGIAAILTHYTIQPAELGRWAEEQGFESLWFLQPSRFGYGGVQPDYGGKLPHPDAAAPASAPISHLGVPF